MFTWGYRYLRRNTDSTQFEMPDLGENLFLDAFSNLSGIKSIIVHSEPEFLNF